MQYLTNMFTRTGLLFFTAFALLLIARPGVSLAGDYKACIYSALYSETQEFDSQSAVDAAVAAGDSGSHSGECDEGSDEDKVCHIPSNSYEPGEEVKIRKGKFSDWQQIYPNDISGACTDDYKGEEICHFPNGSSEPGYTMEVRKSKKSEWLAAHPNDKDGKCSDDDKKGSWESVDTSTAETSANCVAFTTAVSTETKLATYENEMSEQEKGKEEEAKNKRKDEEEKVFSDTANADEHKSKAVEEEDQEYKHKASKDEHEHNKEVHESIVTQLRSQAKVPAGGVVCKTPDGQIGFIPPSASASTVPATPAKKALREIFGK